MKHVMIDLETLGTNPDCVFISIGAVEFDPNTGEFGRECYKVLSIQDQESLGRTMTLSTLQWWKRQSAEARKVLEEAKAPNADLMSSCLTDFKAWLPPSCVVWGNGSTFDIAILENAYTQINLTPRWRFWNVRDVRTIVDLAKGIVERPTEVQGTAHNALDDAKHQARYVSRMWIALRNDINKELA